MPFDGIEIIRDPARLEALNRTGLTTESSRALDRLTRLASRMLDTPLALVNLVEASQQVSVSCVLPEDWSAGREAPLQDSFCKHAVISGEPLLIEDARRDPRVRQSRVTTQEGIRSYLGIPLITSRGHALGTLCVADFRPRKWSGDELEILQELAAAVTSEVELRIAVSETREAEELAEIADRERRDKLALLESTSEGIYGIDREGRCTFINRAGARMVGRGVEECLGRNMHELIHHSHVDGSPYPESECPIYRALRESRSVRTDDVLWRKDGSSFPAEYSASPIREDGEIRGAVVTFSDISARRRDEEAERFFNHAGTVLAASSLDYADTLRSLVRLSVPVLADWCSLSIVREDGQLERLELAHADEAMAEQAEALRRYPPEASPEHPALRVLRTGEPELIPEIGDEMVQQVAQDEEHLRILRALGLRSAMVVPLMARNRILGVLTLVSSRPGRRYTAGDLAVAREFAHRSALALDNARLYGESREANRTKAEFLATVSHELRTPLNAIVGYTSLMRQGIPSPLPADALRYVERIDLSSRHLRQLIEEILSFSRLEAGQETVALSRVPLPELVEEIGAIVEPLAVDKGLTYRAEAPPEPAAIRTDAGKLRQVLVNLLDNAVKFTREGEVGLTVEERGESVLFRVWDTGIGIREEDQPRIFEPFRQLEQANTREAGGTGLGLSVAQRLVRLLGGDLRLESAPGEGTVVTVRLPREPAAGDEGRRGMEP